MKILLEGPLSATGGYGRDLIGLSRTLLERGHSVTLNPLSVQVPLPVDIANLLSTEHYQKPPYDIRISHMPPTDVQLSDVDANNAKVNIWWTMWEYDNYPNEWSDQLRYYTKAFDHFVAYDQGTMSALSPHLDILNKVTVQGGYESEDWKVSPIRERLPSEATFLFGTVGDLTARKNPVVLIQAFRRFKDANPDADAVLMLKTRAPFRGWQAGPFVDTDYGIEEIVDVWDHGQLEAFYWRMGAYVAPSFGEGKNLPALEAATCGVPLILSDIPGHGWAKVVDSVQFVGGKRGNLRLQGIPMGGLMVDVEQLAEALANAYHNRVEYRQRAITNVPTVVSSMDWYRVVERLGLGLEIPWL